MKIGIDLGGTKTEGIVLDENDQLINTIRLPTPQSQGYQSVLENIEHIVLELEQIAAIQCTVGIGTPGAIDKDTGLLKYSNTACLNDRPFLDDLQTLLEREIRIENDANCFALSEAIDGSGSGFKTVFGIIMGTGVGGGLVINKQIINGPNNLTGEWGHSLLKTGGNRCYCGLKGCIETYLSGPGLIENHNHISGTVVQRVEQIVQAALNGDPNAKKTMDQFYNDFALAISQIIKILDPDAIILGGGLSNIDELYNVARSRIKNFVAKPVQLNLFKNKHGDSSGVRGAAYLWA